MTDQPKPAGLTAEQTAEALRDQADDLAIEGVYGTPNLMRDAADLIDRLREENERLRATLNGITTGDTAEEANVILVRERDSLHSRLAEVEDNARKSHDFALRFMERICERHADEVRQMSVDAYIAKKEADDPKCEACVREKLAAEEEKNALYVDFAEHAKECEEHDRTKRKLAEARDSLVRLYCSFGEGVDVNDETPVLALEVAILDGQNDRDAAAEARLAEVEAENAKLREEIRTTLLAEEERRKLTGDALQAEGERHEAEKKLAEVEAECLEQARLNGAGSERDARLLAKLAEVERKVAYYESALTIDDGELTALRGGGVAKAIKRTRVVDLIGKLAEVEAERDEQGRLKAMLCERKDKLEQEVVRLSRQLAESQAREARLRKEIDELKAGR